MSNKYYLIKDKININDRLVHIISQEPVTVTNIKGFTYEVTFDNGFITKYAADILRSIFIRYDNYLRIVTQQQIDRINDELRKFFSRRQNHE